MWEVLVIGIAIVFALFFWAFYVKPKRKIKAYLSMLESLGYKVHVLPFAFMDASFAFIMRSDLKNHKDIFYSSKHDLVGYDVLIGNVLG